MVARRQRDRLRDGPWRLAPNRCRRPSDVAHADAGRIEAVRSVRGVGPRLVAGRQSHCVHDLRRAVVHGERRWHRIDAGDLLAASSHLAAGQAAITYRSADVDADGSLHAVSSDGKALVVAKTAGMPGSPDLGPQTSFGDPVLSDDRLAVAVQANFANCCTSYDIPMQIVVVTNGLVHRFGAELPAFDFHFVDGSRRIAFGMQTVHFACTVSWELHDVRTEKLVARADIPQECGTVPHPPDVQVPSWVSGNVSGIE
jgi:hypothetical protein